MTSLKNVSDNVLNAFNQQDAAALAMNYAEDQVTICSGVPEPVRGRRAKEEFVGGFFRAFPDLNLDLSCVLESQDHVVCEGVMRGTHDGPLVSPEGEIPPTGKGIELRIVYILRVSPEGLVEEDRTYFDNVDFLSQLGLMG
jgi:predicted ester cyclase